MGTRHIMHIIPFIHKFHKSYDDNKDSEETVSYKFKLYALHIPELPASEAL